MISQVNQDEPWKRRPQVPSIKGPGLEPGRKDLLRCNELDLACGTCWKPLLVGIMFTPTEDLTPPSFLGPRQEPNLHLSP